MNKLISVCFMVALSLLVTACGGPSHMIMKEKTTAASIKPEAGKSALVIARTTAYGGGIGFKTYIDRKMIGITKGKSYFAKRNIEPGNRHVIIKGENIEAVQVNFEADKVYFLLQNVYPGIFYARVALRSLNAEMLDNDLGGCTYWEYDTNQPGEDLTEQDYLDAIKKGQKLVIKPNGDTELVPIGK